MDATLPRPHTRPGSRLCQRANVAFATNEGSKLGSQRRALRVVEEQSVLIDRTARQKPLKAAFADVAADKRLENVGDTDTGEREIACMGGIRHERCTGGLDCYDLAAVAQLPGIDAA